MTVADLSARRPRTVLAIAAVATVAAVLLIVLRLRPAIGVAGLFPSTDPATVALARWLDRFPTGNDVLVLATLPAGAPTDAAPLMAFGERLSARLPGTTVVYRLDADGRRFVEQVVGPAAIYYLSDAAYAEAKRRLTRPAMIEQLRQDEALLATPGPAAAAVASALLQDPLHLHELLADRRPGGGAMTSPDGRSLLVRVVTGTQLGDVAANRRVVDTVTAAANTAADGLTVEVSGGPAIAAFDAAAIRRDCIASVVTSVVLLQVVFAVAYRRPWRTFAVAAVPVGLGVVWGFGLRALVGGPIAPAAAVVAAVLVGMGVDYPVLYLPHYAAARADGATAVEAVRRTTAALLSPLSAACLTSLFGFAAVAWSSVPALRDFAVVGMLGLGGALVAAVTVLPAMLVVFDRATRTADPRVTIGPVLAWAVAHRRVLRVGWIAVAVVAVVVLAVGPPLRLTTDLTALHPQPNPPLAAATDIAARMGVDPGSLTVYLRADSPADLVRLAYDVDRRLATDKVRRAGVVGTIGLASLLPDPRVVARRRADHPDADRVVADFLAAVSESDFDPAAFAGYERFLRRMATNPPAPTVADLRPFPRLAESILPRDGDVPEAVTLLLVDRPLSNRAARVAAIDAVRAAIDGLPGVTLTGVGVAGLAAEAAVTHDVPRLLGVAVALNVAYLL